MNFTFQKRAVFNHRKNKSNMQPHSVQQNLILLWTIHPPPTQALWPQTIYSHGKTMSGYTKEFYIGLYSLSMSCCLAGCRWSGLLPGPPCSAWHGLKMTPGLCGPGRPLWMIPHDAVWPHCTTDLPKARHHIRLRMSVFGCLACKNITFYNLLWDESRAIAGVPKLLDVEGSRAKM